MSALIETLQAIVGQKDVVLESSVRAQKAVDLYALRLYQRHVGWEATLPQAVVRPKTTEEVSQVLRLCNERGIPVIPYGGGSGVLAGAETRDERTVVIDLARLNRLIDIDEVSLQVTCGAGMLIKDLEAYVQEEGFKLGHYPQSMDLAQMGGLVATRSTGQFSTGYGSIEDFLVGLEAVLADGTIVRINNVPRRATGPDLRHLFLGSEGAFAIITEVTVKMFPIPEAVWKQAYRVKTMRQGLEVIRQIMRTGIKPAVVRLHDWLECEKPYGAFMEENESMLLFWSEGRKEIAEAEGAVIDEIAKANGAVSAGEKPLDLWYVHRNDAADDYEKYGLMGVLVDTIEVAADWNVIADIYENTVERVYYEVPEVIYFSGHSSHSYINGTNIYFQLGAFPEKDVNEAKRVYDAVWSIVMEVALEYGGTIGHHHGVGKHRIPWITREHGCSYPLMAGLKKMFDPKGIMNPGALVEL
ncbi:MAG: FAD-binding oxidoreductase [Saccharofermentanales bacterium]|jgi:alkyldihydroxyacetonephosphate synthase